MVACLWMCVDRSRLDDPKIQRRIELNPPRPVPGRALVRDRYPRPADGSGPIVWNPYVHMFNAEEPLYFHIRQTFACGRNKRLPDSAPNLLQQRRVEHVAHFVVLSRSGGKSLPDSVTSLEDHANRAHMTLEVTFYLHKRRGLCRPESRNPKVGCSSVDVC